MNHALPSLAAAAALLLLVPPLAAAEATVALPALPALPAPGTDVSPALLLVLIATLVIAVLILVGGTLADVCSGQAPLAPLQPLLDALHDHGLAPQDLPGCA